MYYVTGDVHGGQEMWHEKITPFLKPGDTILVAGDFGVGFFDGRYWPEEMFYDYLAEQPYTVLFCDGNHENFEKLNRYPVTEWHAGKVHRIRENVIHLMRGELYRLQEKSLLLWEADSLWINHTGHPGKAGGRRRCRQKQNMKTRGSI